MKYKINKFTPSKQPSPLRLSNEYGDFIANFVSEYARIIVDPSLENCLECMKKGQQPETFELAGPREKIYFDPTESRAAIVTCGGLCPGLNDVIRSLVMVLYYQYGVRDILGVRYGFRGMTVKYGGTAIPLTPQVVSNINKQGGSFLGSSRGPQNSVEIVDFLQRRNINMLFTLGGDGTIRGSLEIVSESNRRDYPISIIGIPKTIDNDIAFIDKSFGFSTAVARAKEILDSAHAEATGAVRGISIVKLMGRYSGFITARASLASSDANFVLVPEIPFDLEGENGFLKTLERRIDLSNHALIVVAEGSGQDIMEETNGEMGTDASGNKRLVDIGLFLKEKIQAYFNRKEKTIHIKYFDPSYFVRSSEVNAEDSVYCQELAQNAVHAAFSGRTEMVVGSWLNHFVHIPMPLAVSRRKTLQPDGPEWLAVLEATGQPAVMSDSKKVI